MPSFSSILTIEIAWRSPNDDIKLASPSVRTSYPPRESVISRDLARITNKETPANKRLEPESVGCGRVGVKFEGSQVETECRDAN